MDLEALEAGTTRLEDLEAIKQLKARYCEICDDDHNPDRITSVFTKHGIWEGKGIGRAEGHEEIRALFGRFQKMISFSQHMTMNPVIEVDGETAKGTWYFFRAVYHGGRQSGAMAGVPVPRGILEGEWRVVDPAADDQGAAYGG